MDHKNKKTKSQPEVAFHKDDDLEPKGKTKHIVETDWPTKEAAPVNPKKREIKRTQNARLP
jgi:hypothetical protein